MFAESKQATALKAATNDLNGVTPPLWMSNVNRFVFEAQSSKFIPEHLKVHLRSGEESQAQTWNII